MSCAEYIPVNGQSQVIIGQISLALRFEPSVCLCPFSVHVLFKLISEQCECTAPIQPMVSILIFNRLTLIAEKPSGFPVIGSN